MATKSPARDLTTTLFPHEARFVTVNVAGQTAEMSYVERGPATGEPVILLHGNPTLSFLWRDVIPSLEGRCRVIAPDLLGFGRSDKLDRFEDYTLDNHMAALSQLVDALSLERITLVVHDWGGPIGLSYAVDHPERIARLVIMNTWAFAPQAHNRVPQPLKTFRRKPAGELLVLGLNAFVNLALPYGVVRRKERMKGEVMRVYKAPFPTWRSRWPVLAMPRNIPLSPADASYARMKKTDDGLSLLKQPTLLLWGGKDSVFPPRVMEKFKARLTGVTSTRVFDDAHHFLQEDKGREIGEAIAGFVATTAITDPRTSA